MNGKRIGIGFLVSLVIAALVGTYEGFVGADLSVLEGIGVSYAFVVTSIICTAGISLVVWLPVWWVLGAITLSLLERNGANAIEILKTPRLGHVSQAVIKFIQKEIAHGALSRDEINNRLLEMGWSDDTIKQANQIVDSA